MATDQHQLKIEQATSYIERQLKDKASEYAAFSYAEALYNLTEADIEEIKTLRESKKGN